LFSVYGSSDTPLGDTYLYINNSADLVTPLATDDDGGAGTNSIITYTATYTGAHYIGVGAYPGSNLTGGYTLDTVAYTGVDTVPDTFAGAQAVTLDSVSYGFIDPGPGVVYTNLGEVDTYKFTVEAGKYYSIQIAG